MNYRIRGMMYGFGYVAELEAGVLEWQVSKEVCWGCGLHRNWRGVRSTYGGPADVEKDLVPHFANRVTCEEGVTWEEQISPLRDAAHRSGGNDVVVAGLMKCGISVM